MATDCCNRFQKRRREMGGTSDFKRPHGAELRSGDSRHLRYGGLRIGHNENHDKGYRDVSDTIDVFAEQGKLILTDDKLSTKFEKGGQMTVQLYVDPASSKRILKADGKNSKGFTYSANLERIGDSGSAK